MDSGSQLDSSAAPSSWALASAGREGGGPSPPPAPQRPPGPVLPRRSVPHRGLITTPPGSAIQETDPQAMTSRPGYLLRRREKRLLGAARSDAAGPAQDPLQGAVLPVERWGWDQGSSGAAGLLPRPSLLPPHVRALTAGLLRRRLHVLLRRERVSPRPNPQPPAPGQPAPGPAAARTASGTRAPNPAAAPARPAAAPWRWPGVPGPVNLPPQGRRRLPANGGTRQGRRRGGSAAATRTANQWGPSGAANGWRLRHRGARRRWAGRRGR